MDHALPIPSLLISFRNSTLTTGSVMALGISRGSYSRTTSLACLSDRNPRKTGCRSWSSCVHSVNILAQNVSRRHLTTGQKATIATEIANVPKEANQHLTSVRSSTTQEQAAVGLPY